MEMGHSVANLLTKSWWQYGQDKHSWFSATYHTFNLFEGGVWCLFALLVALRFAKHRRSWFEVGYALSFVSFGASDFCEAYTLKTWLILAKIANLIVLIALRSYLTRRFYPNSKTY